MMIFQKYKKNFKLQNKKLSLYKVKIFYFCIQNNLHSWNKSNKSIELIISIMLDFKNDLQFKRN